MALKMAVFAPIPSANRPATASVNPGLRSNIRTA